MNLSQLDIDDLINDSYKKQESVEKEIKYELLIFTDGAHERVKKRSSFGIYILCKNKNSNLNIYNETKIIKKITKDTILYNKTNKDIHYHSIFKNITNEKCQYENCNYFAIYSNNKNENGIYCKNHKNDSLIQSMNFENYEPTNIRAEGLAIVYGLLYLKNILIDKIDKSNLVNELNTKVFEESKLVFQEYKEENNKEYKYYQLITDSEFWINVITKWSNNWIRQNTILEKKNIDINYYINRLLNELLNDGHIIHFKFVRGHADTKEKNNKYNLYQKGNIIADKLANIAKENTNYNVKISFAS